MDQVFARPKPPLDMGSSGGGMVLEHLPCRFYGAGDEIPVALEIGEAEQRLPALPFAEIFTRSAHLEVLLRNSEAIGGLEDHFQASPCVIGQRLAVEQHANTFARTAPDPAAQLVELRKSEPLGALDH